MPKTIELDISRLSGILTEADIGVLASEMSFLGAVSDQFRREMADAITSGVPGEQLRTELLNAFRVFADELIEMLYREIASRTTTEATP